MNPRAVMLCFALMLPVTAALADGAIEQPVFDTALAATRDQHLTVTTVTYAPGAKSPPHFHDRAVFVYVLAGAVRSQLEGQPVHVYGTGQSWFEAPGVHHVICENASSTRPAKFLVIYVGAAPSNLRHAHNSNT